VLENNVLRRIITGTEVREVRGGCKKSHNEKFMVHLLFGGIYKNRGRDKACIQNFSLKI
jgi:hypothetical protein